MISFPLSEKDKEKARSKKVTAEILRRIGTAYYAMSLADRHAMHDKVHEELFGTSTQEPQTFEKTAPILITKEAETSAPSVQSAPIVVTPPALPSTPSAPHQSFALSVQLNAKQQLAAEFAENGKCFVLTGAAGTGKTTSGREIARRLLLSTKLGRHTFRVKETGSRVSAPSIAFVAYTNRAANNLRKAIHRDAFLAEQLPVNITTIHNLLEYAPVYYEVDDGKGGTRTTMRFEPQRHSARPLDITHLVIEESSQVGAHDLYRNLFDALRAGTQIIFMGDINQLQPIFSPAILNYALVTLPVVTLDEVYRQALDSPIIANAHRCLRGETLESVPPHFRIIDGSSLKKIPSQAKCAELLTTSLKKWYAQTDADGSRTYDPEQDIVLSPWNVKDLGTDALNSRIAQFLGTGRKEPVYEIFAGMRKLYLAVGDHVMVAKQNGIITAINRNGNYIGRAPRPESTGMTRFGVYIPDGAEMPEDDPENLEITGYENVDIDNLGGETENEKRKQQATHVVHVELESGATTTCSTAGDFSPTEFSLAYALTVHKAEGCEWRKVFIVLHRDHIRFVHREWLYTAITRAREYCTIIDLCNTRDQVIAQQKIKGATIEEKIEYFNSKVSLEEPVAIIP